MAYSVVAELILVLVFNVERLCALYIYNSRVISRGIAVRIVRKPPERMRRAFPLSKCRWNT